MGQYTDAGLVQFARTDRFPNLRELAIGCWLGDAKEIGFGAPGIEALLRFPATAHCRLVVALVSADPLPGDIQGLADAHADRVGIEYQKPPPSRLSSFSCP